MENLEDIAVNYHLSGKMPDMFIEKVCQEFEIKWVSKHINQNSTILDLGLGDSLYLLAFRDHPSFTILEGSKSLAEYGQRMAISIESEIQVRHTYFESFSPEEQYDIIIASHVLEHVQDPKKLLTLCKTWLKPNGKLIIIVPNCESLHRRLGLLMGLQKELAELSPRDKMVGHQRVYSVKSLTMEIEESGFRAFEIRGFFTKTLSNAQMLNLAPEVIEGLCELSSILPAEMGANIGMVCKRA
jgi:2-polyprenyl-3-methyl-5-hydroxy-6-metoxy-1,4-benzoquinol methylase